MRNKKTILSLFSMSIFLFSIIAFSSCGGGNQSLSKSKVKSGSSMGNMKHKNKHVWGKPK